MAHHGGPVHSCLRWRPTVSRRGVKGSYVPSGDIADMEDDARQNPGIPKRRINFSVTGLRLLACS